MCVERGWVRVLGNAMGVKLGERGMLQSIMMLAETIAGTARAKPEPWRPLARLRPFLRGA